MRPLVDNTAPNATVDDAVLMNSLLDVAGIVGSSRKLVFRPSWSSIQAGLPSKLVFHPNWSSILDKQRPKSFIGANR
jgi:hypothetical protein